jgi:preprotein translocase subunit SecD
LGAAFRAVRHTAFLTRRDVERAALVASPDDASTFTVELTLTAEGAAKAKEYTTANTGKCVSLVAGGKVLWTAALDTPVEGDTFVLSGAFSGTRGIAIVDLFGQ